MAVNLRNKPVDKRRLKAEDRGFNTKRREMAVKRAAARRGQAAYAYSRRPNTTKKQGNNNAFAPGIQTQQKRMQQLSAEKARSEAMRPEKASLPSIAF